VSITRPNSPTGSAHSTTCVSYKPNDPKESQRAAGRRIRGNQMVGEKDNGLEQSSVLMTMRRSNRFLSRLREMRISPGATAAAARELQCKRAARPSE